MWTGLRGPQGRVALVAGAILCVALALAVTPRPHPPSAPAPDCTRAFPVRLFPAPTTDQELTGLVVCTDDGGTAALIRNHTRAVWAVEGASAATLVRLPMSSLNRSFLDLLQSDAASIPAGASVIALRAPSAIALRVQPSLTVAQLTHDQLVGALGLHNQLMWAALQPGPGLPRRALFLCMMAVLQEAGDASGMLASGEPAGALAAAATTAARQPISFCRASWLEAKISAGLPSDEVTSLGKDISGWGAAPAFAERGHQAAGVFRHLTGGPRMFVQAGR